MVDPLRRALRPGIAVGMALGLLGCATVGPEMQSPEVDLPQAYDAPVPAPFSGDEAAAAARRWWTSFRDPTLSALVEEALKANLDVRVAASRVREARATARGVDAGTGPSVTATGEAIGTAAQESGGDDGDDDGESGGTVTGILDAEWEIDLFGGLQRRREAAEAAAARQAVLRREVQRTIAAEVARTYIELRAAERRRALLEQSLDLQVRTLRLVQQRVESGLARRLDAIQAQAQVDQLRADVGPLSTEVRRRRNALAVLLGVAPGELDPLLIRQDDAGIPQTQAGGAVGAPAELLRRRPDVQAAELQIAVATAEVGVATAELYPSLSLPGRLSVGTADLFTGSPVATALARLSLLVEFPLFDGGQREAELTAAEERLRQAALTYRQTVLRAIQDVESAMVGYRGTRDRLNALVAAVDANRSAFEQSRALYREGLTSFLDVLDSQRQLNTSRQELAQARRDLALETVNLYSALGGLPMAQAPKATR
ncbi:efflux transporter outer membrane subunit [Rhodovibrio sodomensis]|nr:efflux transporter outer membrane subunit [Rhodovibrio sodomensis]